MKMLLIDQCPALDLMQGRINMTTLQQMLNQVNISNEQVTLKYQWQNLYSALHSELQDNQLISQINSLNRRLDQIRIQYEHKSSDSSKLREIVSKLQSQQRVITPERNKDEFKNQNSNNETRSISPGINFGLTKQAPSVVTPTRNSNQQQQLPDSLQSQRQKNYMKVSTPQQPSTIKTDQYQMQSGEMLVSTRSKSPNASPLPQWTIPKKDAIKGTQIFSIKVHEKRVSAIAIAPECVFTASYDKQIRSWDKVSGAPRFIHEGHRKEVLCLKFKHEVLISGGLDKEVRIWKHSPRYQMANILKGHEQAVTCLDFINQTQIVSGSTDHTFRVWDINKATLLYVQQFPGPIHSLLLEKELLYLASGPVIFNFKISNFQKIDEKVLHESNIIQIVLTQQYLITICEEGIIKVSDRQQLSREIKSFKDDYEISCAIYIQKLDILAVGLCNKNGDGKLCLWNIDTQKKLLDLSQNGSGVGALQFDDYLYSGHENKCLQAIKLE